MKKRIILFIILISVWVHCSSQTATPQILNATGGTGNHNNFFLDWSCGELLGIETLASPNSAYFITEGILQPLRPVISTDPCWTNKELRIYPNPTTGLIDVAFLSVQTGKITLVLYDASGKMMTSKQFTSFGLNHVESLDLTRYAAGTYFLVVILEPTGASVRRRCTYPIEKFNR